MSDPFFITAFGWCCAALKTLLAPEGNERQSQEQGTPMQGLTQSLQTIGASLSRVEGALGRIELSLRNVETALKGISEEIDAGSRRIADSIIYAATYENELKARARMEQAWRLMNAGVLDEATRAINDARELDPSDARVWLLTALCRVKAIASGDLAVISSHPPSHTVLLNAYRLINASESSAFTIWMLLLAASRSLGCPGVFELCVTSSAAEAAGAANSIVRLRWLDIVPPLAVDDGFANDAIGAAILDIQRRYLNEVLHYLASLGSAVFAGKQVNVRSPAVPVQWQSETSVVGQQIATISSVLDRAMACRQELNDVDNRVRTAKYEISCQDAPPPPPFLASFLVASRDYLSDRASFFWTAAIIVAAHLGATGLLLVVTGLVVSVNGASDTAASQHDAAGTAASLLSVPMALLVGAFFACLPDSLFSKVLVATGSTVVAFGFLFSLQMPAISCYSFLVAHKVDGERTHALWQLKAVTILIMLGLDCVIITAWEIPKVWRAAQKLIQSRKWESEKKRTADEVAKRAGEAEKQLPELQKAKNKVEGMLIAIRQELDKELAMLTTCSARIGE